jgi:hypothetical protein
MPSFRDALPSVFLPCANYTNYTGMWLGAKHDECVARYNGSRYTCRVFMP